MPIRRLPFLFAVAAVLAAMSALPGTVSGAGAAGVTLKPHRAVYDLKLVRAQGRRAIEAVRGRILYDFGGNSCEGYALQFRQVSELDAGEGKKTLSDLRATSWEDGEAKAFRFSSQNYMDQRPLDTVDGRAERRPDAVSVTLVKPSAKKVDLDHSVIFPTEHMRRIIEAAMAGKTILEVPVFDGSETGEKIFNTLAVIGREVPRLEKPLTDASSKVAGLSELRRWPVRISYFDRRDSGGEQTPVYAIGFELFENGISRSLSLDYGDFVISGELSQLEVTEAKPCK